MYILLPILNTIAREESAPKFSWRYNPMWERFDWVGQQSLNVLNRRLNQLRETGARAVPCCSVLFRRAPRSAADGPCPKPARTAAVLPLAASSVTSWKSFSTDPRWTLTVTRRVPWLRASPVLKWRPVCLDNFREPLATNFCVFHWRYLSVFFFPHTPYLHILLQKNWFSQGGWSPSHLKQMNLLFS